MKIIINYDFMDEVLNARDGKKYIFRIVRQKKNMLMLNFPI